MTAPPAVTPSQATPGPGSAPVAVTTPARLAWLESELTVWSAEGLVDPATARAIRDRYVAHRRVTLSRIVLTLGAAFVGLGLIWLVAANLDAMSPLVRFGLVTLVWLGLVAAGEALAGRRARDGDHASPVVGALRLLAVAGYGAVLFQAAQSLQVPAYEPALVGLWALGALAFGYAVGAAGPVVVGIVLGAGWTVWHVADTSADPLAATLAVAAVALLGVAVGVLHRRLPPALVPAGLGVPWREVGAVLALGALYVAALPVGGDPMDVGPLLVVLPALAVLAAGAAAALGDRVDRAEVALATAAALLVAVLVAWRPSAGLTDPTQATGADLGRAVLAVAVFLAVASGYAVLGGRRDSDRVTWLAAAALVLFTTTQAFAVFAPVLSGAVLFLAVGLVLLATGVLADRGRRRLVRRGKEGS